MGCLRLYVVWRMLFPPINVYYLTALMSTGNVIDGTSPAMEWDVKEIYLNCSDTLLMKVAIGFLITSMFWVSSILFSATDRSMVI